jgi:hypothetical protein
MGIESVITPENSWITEMFSSQSVNVKARISQIDEELL